MATLRVKEETKKRLVEMQHEGRHGSMDSLLMELTGGEVEKPKVAKIVKTPTAVSEATGVSVGMPEKFVPLNERPFKGPNFK